MKQSFVWKWCYIIIHSHARRLWNHPRKSVAQHCSHSFMDDV